MFESFTEAKLKLFAFMSDLYKEYDEVPMWSQKWKFLLVFKTA